MVISVAWKVSRHPSDLLSSRLKPLSVLLERIIIYQYGNKKKKKKEKEVFTALH